MKDMHMDVLQTNFFGVTQCRIEKLIEGGHSKKMKELFWPRHSKDTNLQSNKNQRRVVDKLH